MRHENSVFHGLQKLVPWSVFERLVDSYQADHRIRRLSTKSQFLALLFGQLAGASSLREIVTGLASHEARLYHVGARVPARSTFADANAQRPSGLFADLFAHMAATASRKVRRQLGGAVRILDSTHIRLNGLSAAWLDPQKGQFAAKLHLVFDPEAGTPAEAVLTDQCVHDLTPAKAMQVQPGMTYVFDLGYYDYAWWAELNSRKCRIVTRFKTHTPLQVIVENQVPAQSGIISDRIGLLPERQARSRKNPMSAPVREITVRISTGKILRVLSNDLEAPATEIAGLYKQRWQIELFFKWLKQNLKIKHFIGTSQNAVRIQIFVALIAYILLRMAMQTQKAVAQPLAFARLVRLNIMHKRPISQLSRLSTQPQKTTAQMEFQWT